MGFGFGWKGFMGNFGGPFGGVVGSGGVGWARLIWPKTRVKTITRHGIIFPETIGISSHTICFQSSIRAIYLCPEFGLSGKGCRCDCPKISQSRHLFLFDSLA
jgi:hypothetical protein